MNNQVSVSVCIATFNGAYFIERQLSSILPLLSETDEVIISDDNSTDNTLFLIQTFEDIRIKVYINNGNRGPVKNFENALGKATKDYIILSDQDDIWCKEKVILTKKLLKSYDLVLFDCQVVDNNEKIILNSFFNYRKSRSGFIRNFVKNSYIGCCMVFRRNILSFVLPFPEQIHMHDWWIGLLVELKGSVYFCDQITMKYVRHGGNFSPTGEQGYGLYEKTRIRINMLFCLIRRLISANKWIQQS